MHDLSLNFYKITKETDINSLKNKNNHGLYSITQAFINTNEEATVVEIRLPEILSDENKKMIKILYSFLKQSIIKGENNHVLFIDDFNMRDFNEEERIDRMSFINECGLCFIVDSLLSIKMK